MCVSFSVWNGQRHGKDFPKSHISSKKIHSSLFNLSRLVSQRSLGKPNIAYMMMRRRRKPILWNRFFDAWWYKTTRCMQFCRRPADSKSTTWKSCDQDGQTGGGRTLFLDKPDQGLFNGYLRAGFAFKDPHGSSAFPTMVAWVRYAQGIRGPRPRKKPLIQAIFVVKEDISSELEVTLKV